MHSYRQIICNYQHCTMPSLCTARNHIYIQAMYNMQIHINIIHIIYNIHINNNNNYVQLYHCATNDSTAQPPQLSAYSGLTSASHDSFDTPRKPAIFLGHTNDRTGHRTDGRSDESHVQELSDLSVHIWLEYLRHAMGPHPLRLELGRRLNAVHSPCVQAWPVTETNRELVKH